MRRRQRKKIQTLEQERAARQEREAAAELESRVIYSVTFDDTTVAQMDECDYYRRVRFVDGHMVGTDLKRDGILTAVGVEVYAELRKKAGFE